MERFVRHTGLVAPLDRPDVDTDAIIPKQFLKRIERTGYGPFLFHDWRYRPDGSPDPDFVLNQPRYRGATILLARENFGCGSSREHAPWALQQYGFRAIVAPSFADIFEANCLQNGLLPVRLEPEAVEELFRRTGDQPGYQLTVDLEREEVRDASGFVAAFRVDPERRRRLLEGVDDIDVTLAREAAIAAFEARRPSWSEIAWAAAGEAAGPGRGGREA
ncbi:MAG: 3-isopropylmalate dehydratase small subunit [Bacillota bacterium]|nr:3-isopropylmalate dehydratase small subunit [Bacillota bacterium]